MKRVLARLLSYAILLFLGGYSMIQLIPQLGAKSTGDRKQKIADAPNFSDGVFQNQQPTTVQSEDMSMLKAMKAWLKKDPSRSPIDTIETFSVHCPATEHDVHYSWLGHSSIFLDIHGTAILVDPVFSTSASPFQWMGPKRYQYTILYKKETLPKIDLIVITHDHYDHLDYESILAYKNTVQHYFVPLGVGAHLERWGVDPTKITELNWHQSAQWNDLAFTATPARHFSGRGLADRNSTLWASWVITCGNHSVFLSGDSGYGAHFAQIGSQYGPFDVAFIECGQYNKWWPQIHAMPEESVQACIDLQAKTAVPIHWGKFSLSLHSWKDPIERFTKEAKKKGLRYATPKPGECYTADSARTTPWWEELE